jgi:hypothetical protein
VEGSHSQPQGSPLTTSLTTSEVVRTPKEHIVDKELKVLSKERVKELNRDLHNLEVSDFDSLIDSGMKPEEVEDALATLLPLFAAEGLKPSSRVLTDSIRQLHRDAR